MILYDYSCNEADCAKYEGGGRNALLIVMRGAAVELSVDFS